ncbi:glycosyl transferase [Trichoderma arundinaceum]|uniref:Glycosyl transferase n=1 Tax=Trichoderma arundinaceum TaxID=490622 RepID=A0A395NQE8_TRIAR|nr:glycosyl transferase [Trichoderma arundinaceum]
MLLRIPFNVLLPYLFALSIILHIYSRFSYPVSTPSSLILNTQANDQVRIPNIVHFVYVVNDPLSDLHFEFKHYLSIYSVHHYWQPHVIYLHTNAHPDVLERCRSGSLGKWSKLLVDLPNIQFINATIPTHAGNGKEIQGMEHKSDFVRVKAVHEYGGVYIDFDVYPLRDIAILRESGFRAIAGRQDEGQINSGTFMSVKHGKVIKLWMEGMHQAYTGGWTTHSNEVITKIGERLVSEPGEMLIMEREAFAPGGWWSKDANMLFAAHSDVQSNLNDREQGDDLPSYKESINDRWEHPEAFPSWARDWSKTYLLHAFNPFRFSKKIDGFEHITPRYVLERKSNFARAVYPVAKHLYDRGMLNIDDSHL